MSYTKVSGVQILAMAAALPESYAPLLTAIGIGKPVSKEEYNFFVDNGQTTSDLGFAAAAQLIEHKGIAVSDIGVLLFVSRTYDYRGPITAAILQHRLQIPKDCIAFDIPHGPTGLVTGLLLAASQLKVINKPLALVIVGDTPDKMLEGATIGAVKANNACAAFLLSTCDEAGSIEGEVFTHSSHFADMIFPGGGFRLKDSGSVEKRSFGINFEDPEQMIVDVEALRIFNETEVHEFWSSSTIGSQFPKDHPYGLVVQVNDLNLLSLKEPFYGRDFWDKLCTAGSFGAATLPLLLNLVYNGIEQEFPVAFVCGGEGFSAGILRCNLTKDVLVPTVFTNAVFEGAWSPADY